MKTTVQRWGWCQPNLTRPGVKYNCEPSVQSETFSTADTALEALRGRLGDKEFTLEQAMAIGIHLCRVEVTTRVVSVLQ